MPVSRTDVGQACGTYVDFAGNIGIGGTPVIDPLSQTMYFVTRTKENGTFVQRLHAIDMRDGSERPGSPLVIQASVSGTGDGRDAQNNIAFNARTHNQRAGLLLDHGTVYIAWASYCDQGPYHGWILGYDAASLQQVMVYNTSPDGGLGGIWQSGGGLAADAAGNLYALTGNGSFNGDVGGRNFGNSFIKVSPTGTLLDWFTPFNWSFLNATDEDLGIQNALLIPNTNLVVGGGKEGVMYVLDRNNMGHFRSGNNGQIVQSFQASSAARMNGAPVYLEQSDLRAGDLRLARRRSAQSVPSGRRSVHDAGQRAEHARSPPAACLEGCCRCRPTAARPARAFCGRRCRAPGTPITRRSPASCAPTTRAT